MYIDIVYRPVSKAANPYPGLTTPHCAHVCLVCVHIGVLTSGGHVEHGSHPLHPAVRLLTLWSVLSLDQALYLNLRHTFFGKSPRYSLSSV